MKRFTKFYFFILIYLLYFPLFADLTFFPENPAIFSERSYTNFEFPIVDFNLMATNDVFTISNIEQINKMLKDDYTLSQEDKDLITKGDFNIESYNRVSLIEFGKRNWNFSSELFAVGSLNNMDKEFLELIFEGAGVGGTNANDMNKIVSNIGDGSEGKIFIKTKLTYSKLNPVYLYDIFDFTDIDATFYPGFNVNIYSPATIANIKGSSQIISFGDTAISKTKHEIVYAKSASKKTSFGSGFGFGIGFKMLIEKGWIYFSVDDLMNTMSFKDVEQIKLIKTIEPNNTQNIIENSSDTTNIAGFSVELKPTIVAGIEYYFTKDFSLMLRFKDSEYQLDNGLSTGINYTIAKKYPFQLFGGQANEKMYYTVKTGYLGTKYESTFSFTFYDGFFSQAKGIGLGIDIFNIKFY